MRQNRSALDQALSVASLINGPVLGVFLVGTFLRRVSEPPALIGMLASMIVMLLHPFLYTDRVDLVCTHRQPNYSLSSPGWLGLRSRRAARAPR